MFKKLFSKLPFVLAILAIVVMEFFLFRSNYVAGTWLVGWDSTQPEFFLKGHFWRDIYSVWQEYRGLGVLDGMAHSVNVIHTIYIWLLSLILPLNVVRYVFVMLMHALGGIGMFFLIYYFLRKRNVLTSVSAALVGSFFYLFNPGTIQMFFTPLELFIVHFGFLPWLLLVLYAFYNTGLKRYLWLFLLVNILALPQAHVPTIFIVYLVSVAAISIYYLLSNFRQKLRSVVMVVLVLFGVNAFWGIPYIYSTINNTKVITQAKINRLSNEEIILRNEAYGDIKSVSLLYGFNLDYEDTFNGEFDYQLKVWREQWYAGNNEKIGYLFFGLALLGIVAALIKKQLVYLPFVFLFLFALINLSSTIPVASDIKNFLWRIIPYYKEVFRFTFTKFIILYALSISLFVSVALENAFSIWKVRYFSPLIAGIVILILLHVHSPVFSGNFLYNELKLNIPEEYFQVFDFFQNTKNSGRVALLPQPSIWNWEFTRWGYRGSGFVWQGFNNPLLHRSFDPWSSENETYYSELSDALYKDDLVSFENVLNKYRVRWIMFDKYIYQPGGWPEALHLVNTQHLLNTSKHIVVENIFGNLVIYKTDFNDSFAESSVSNISAPTQYAILKNVLKYDDIDPLYGKYGNYITKDTSQNNYPFLDVLRQEPVNLFVQDNAIILPSLKVKPENSTLMLSSWSQKERYLPLDVYAVNSGNNVLNLKFVSLYPDIKINGNSLYNIQEKRVSVPLRGSNRGVIAALNNDYYFKIPIENNEQYLGTITTSYAKEMQINIYGDSALNDINLIPTLSDSVVNECWKRNQNYKVDKTYDQQIITLSSVDATACISKIVPISIPDNSLAELTIIHKSDTGTAPEICLIRIGDSNCMGSNFFQEFGASKEWSSDSSYYNLARASSYQIYVSARGSNVPKENSIIEYKGITLKRYPSIGKSKFTPIDDFSLEERKISLSRDDVISLTVPLGKEGDLGITENWSNRRGLNSDTNCDVFKRGEFQKSNSANSVFYSVRNKAAICDYFVYAEPYSDTGYLLRLMGENYQGRSVKLTVNNHLTRRNEIEVLLGKNRFDQLFTLFPQPNQARYDVNLETKSFGSEISENRLTKLQLIPLPFNWLTDIFITDTNEDIIFNNNVSDLSTFRNSISNYTVNFKAQPQSLITLDQAYQGGWQMYSFNRKQINLIQKLFPAISGKKLTHVQVNSWQNGWMVDNDSQCEQGCFAIITYWPQKMLFLGYAIFIISILVLIGVKLDPEKGLKSGMV